PAFADVGDDGYDHNNPLGNEVYLGDCVANPNYCNDKLIGIVSYPQIVDLFLPERPAIGIDYNGHGSHVASAAAGNELHNVPVYESVSGELSDYTFPVISGVAPHANIVSYQVCYPSIAETDPLPTGCLPNLTVEAVEHAITNGVDVINYSVGGAATDPWEELDALAFLNARLAGIHVVTSATNSGPEPKTIGQPGNAPWLTSVAAASHDRGFAGKRLTGFSGGNSAPTDMTGKSATLGVTAPIVYAGDYDDAGCLEPFAAGTFNGEIVVCERGVNPRVAKGINVREGGAGGLVLINLDTTGLFSELVDDFHVLPAIHLSAADGQALLAWLQSGTGHQATITEATLIEDDSVADV
ncbi:MAG: S8 family serine peptidase, partial [Gammaproteobacteria bacterium]|nr:S8 family serine peptidase [Gammaproteobacteria bacterium]